MYFGNWICECPFSKEIKEKPFVTLEGILSNVLSVVYYQIEHYLGCMPACYSNILGSYIQAPLKNNKIRRQQQRSGQRILSRQENKQNKVFINYIALAFSFCVPCFSSLCAVSLLVNLLRLPLRKNMKSYPSHKSGYTIEGIRSKVILEGQCFHTYVNENMYECVETPRILY